MASSSNTAQTADSASLPAAVPLVVQDVNVQPPTPAPVFTALSDLDATGDFSIKVLICRAWEAKNPNGKYLGTEYVISDDKGNAMHAIARSSIAHCVVPKLAVGEIYNIRRFTVAPNKDLYRLRREDMFLIHFESNSFVHKLECPDSGFTRHPFQISSIEDISYTGNKYLIDVVGRVFDLGVCKPTRNGSQVIEFLLANERGSSIKVSLWGPVAADLSNRASQTADVYVLLLPAMSVREYKGTLQLSSTSGTQIFDTTEITEITALQQLMRQSPIAPQLNRGTLLQILGLGREQHGVADANSVALICCATIKAICPKTPWNYSSCEEKGCKKGLTPIGTQMYCASCEKICQYPVIRYRLRLELSDATTTLVVTLFDDIVECMVRKSAAALVAAIQENEVDAAEYPDEILQLVGATFEFELKSHTYYNHGHYESFTVSRVVNAPPPHPEPPICLASNAVPELQSHPIHAEVDTTAATAAPQNTSESFTGNVEPGTSSHNPLKRKMEGPPNDGN